MSKFFAVRVYGSGVDGALLLLRLVAGFAFLLHGWPKIQNLTSWGSELQIPALFQALAAIAEYGGGLAYVLGLLTRLGALGVFIDMAVAVIMHFFVLGDPFVHPTGGRSFELASIYLLTSLLLMTTGPGRFSLDRRIFGIK